MAPASNQRRGRGRPPGPAESAEEEAARQAWSTYLDALAPYLVTMLVTPLVDARGAPDSLVDLHEQVERAFGITPAFLKKHVYLSKANLAEGRWWTLVLHQLAHSDTTHLVNNMLSIVLHGKKVHKRLGTQTFYTLLVGGATAAGYLHVLGKREELNAFTQVQGLLPRNPFGDASRAGRWYDATVNRFAGFVAPRVSIPAIGASGGACCLMGASVVINLEELVAVAADLARIRGSRTTSAEREVVLRRSVVRFVFIGANLFSLCSCFASELQQAKPKSGDMVNHRSHVDGFVIGGVFYLAWRYGPGAWARLKGQFGGAGNGGGGNGGSGGTSDNIWE